MRGRRQLRMSRLAFGLEAWTGLDGQDRIYRIIIIIIIATIKTVVWVHAHDRLAKACGSTVPQCVDVRIANVSVLVLT